MKQLQNNFTTPEQSKRLLESGIPADSCDCQYYAVGEEWGWEKPALRDESKPLEYNCTPCWSVGRLIEIYLKCHIDASKGHADIYKFPIYRDGIIDGIMTIFEESNSFPLGSQFVFSKLEG